MYISIFHIWKANRITLFSNLFIERHSYICVQTINFIDQVKHTAHQRAGNHRLKTANLKWNIDSLVKALDSRPRVQVSADYCCGQVIYTYVASVTKQYNLVAS